MRFPTTVRERPLLSFFQVFFFQDSSAKDGAPVKPMAPVLKDIMFYDLFRENTWVNL